MTIYPLIVAVTLFWAFITCVWALSVSPESLKKTVGLPLVTMAVGMGGLFGYYVALTTGLLPEEYVNPLITRSLLIADKLAVIFFIPLTYRYFLGVTPLTTLRQIIGKIQRAWNHQRQS